MLVAWPATWLAICETWLSAATAILVNIEKVGCVTLNALHTNADV